MENINNESIVLNDTENVKYFKRNLVESMEVPPVRIISLKNEIGDIEFIDDLREKGNKMKVVVFTDDCGHTRAMKLSLDTLKTIVDDMALEYLMEYICTYGVDDGLEIAIDDDKLEERLKKVSTDEEAIKILKVIEHGGRYDRIQMVKVEN